MPVSKERLTQIATIADGRIDISDIPEMDETFFTTAKLIVPAVGTEKSSFPRMDEDALD